ncbi:hypothetical protein V8G54_010687 [Vigna mungo]|uniref:RNase H type-1 domain-containing protein n=1 Tax=Vigna mungo TaxID=3915 RepID=A0AAQ3NXJ9_VIGMU
MEEHRDNSKFRRLVWWTPPPKGCVKINCDGAYTRNGKKAAAGGVLRDSGGEFLFAFSRVLRVGSSVEAELFAIKLGMEIGISMGYSNLIVESDLLSAIQLINRRVIQQTHQFYALVSSIIYMAVNVHHITWNHAYGLSLSSNSPIIFLNFLQISFFYLYVRIKLEQCITAKCIFFSYLNEDISY